MSKELKKLEALLEDFSKRNFNSAATLRFNLLEKISRGLIFQNLSEEDIKRSFEKKYFNIPDATNKNKKALKKEFESLTENLENGYYSVNFLFEEETEDDNSEETENSLEQENKNNDISNEVEKQEEKENKREAQTMKDVKNGVSIGVSQNQIVVNKILSQLKESENNDTITKNFLYKKLNELTEKLKGFTFGRVYKDGTHLLDEKDWKQGYSQYPEEFEISKRGTCTDHSIYTHDYLNKLGIKSYIYNMCSKGKNHFIIIIPFNGKFIYYEPTIKLKERIREYNTKEDLFADLYMHFRKGNDFKLRRVDFNLAGRTIGENLKLVSKIIPEFDSETNEKLKIKLYHLSKEKIGKMIPRIPKSDYEEQETPRICFAKSIQGCLIGINENKDISNEIFNVYSIETDKYYEPTKEEVQDVDITEEVWIMDEVTPKFESKIKVDGIARTFKAKIRNKMYNIPLWKFHKIQ